MCIYITVGHAWNIYTDTSSLWFASHLPYLLFTTTVCLFQPHLCLLEQLSALKKSIHNSSNILNSQILALIWKYGNHSISLSIFFPHLCMILMRILQHEWYRLRNECNRINSFELWLHNGNRLPWMNPCLEVMNSRANALQWVHLYYCITPESIDKARFFWS